MQKFKLTLILVLLTCFYCSGQTPFEKSVKVKGAFLQDSIKVGAKVKFKLMAIHPEGIEIVFPDSGRDYSPFEFVEKEYFTTKTENGVSIDSAVYTLTSFSADSFQSLNLPVWILKGKDSVEATGAGDTLIFKSVLPKKVSVDSLSFSPDEFRPLVTPRFNYWFWVPIAAGVLLFIALIWRNLKRPVQRAIRLFTLYRRHQTFLVNFERLCLLVRREKTPVRMEAVLALWKLYLERLEDIPYSSFTSREILQVLHSDALSRALEESDRWIYGGIVVENPATIFLNLKNLAQERYLVRRNLVRNG